MRSKDATESKEQAVECRRLCVHGLLASHPIVARQTNHIQQLTRRSSLIQAHSIKATERGKRESERAPARWSRQRGPRLLLILWYSLLKSHGTYSIHAHVVNIHTTLLNVESIF